MHNKSDARIISDKKQINYTKIYKPLSILLLILIFYASGYFFKSDIKYFLNTFQDTTADLPYLNNCSVADLDATNMDPTDGEDFPKFLTGTWGSGTEMSLVINTDGEAATLLFANNKGKCTLSPGEVGREFISQRQVDSTDENTVWFELKLPPSTTGPRIYLQVVDHGGSITAMLLRGTDFLDIATLTEF